MGGGEEKAPSPWFTGAASGKIPVNVPSPCAFRKGRGVVRARITARPPSAAFFSRSDHRSRKEEALHPNDRAGYAETAGP